MNTPRTSPIPENVTAWRWLARLPAALVRYMLHRISLGRWRADRVVLPESGHTLFVDPSENRGKILYLTGGLTQPRLNRFWSSAVRSCEPTIVLDIGVNYGECLFSAKYPAGCSIIGIEANAALKPYIDQSKRAHPNRAQIRTHFAIASDEIRDKRSFFVHKHWSGLSAAALDERQNPQHYARREIRSITVDSLLRHRPLERSRIVFKIDVEGHEFQVLRGMAQCLKRCPAMLGMVEFDSKYVQKAQTDADAYLAFLQRHFDVYAYKSQTDIFKIGDATLQGIRQRFGKKDIHTDLILATPGTPLPPAIQTLVRDAMVRNNFA